MPVPQLGRQIAPRAAGALEVEHRFEELALGHFTRRAGRGMLGSGDGWLELLPDVIVDDFAHGMLEHPKLQSAPGIFVHIIIREQNLVHR